MSLPFRLFIPPSPLRSSVSELAPLASTINSTTTITLFQLRNTTSAALPEGLSSTALSSNTRVMDKMSKFRRKQKPKPPTIDTSVPRVSTETTDSFRSDKGPTAVAAAAAVNTTSSSSAPSSPTSKTKRAAAAKAAAKEAKNKKSPFRGLSLGNYRKRARGSPPAELSSSPPQPAVVGQDGTSSLKSYRLSTDYDHESRARSAQDAPRMPAFLSLSEQGMYRNGIGHYLAMI